MIEFLFGTLAGLIAALLILNVSGTKILQRLNLLSVNPVASDNIALERAENLPVESRGPTLEPARTETIPVAIATAVPAAISAPSKSPVGPFVAMPSCPGCGLEAPDSLMVEHLRGSPSHIMLQPRLPLVAANKVAQERLPVNSSEKDTGDSLRQLLQMLVPPRAFGRRHGQRTVDPLSNLVETIGPSPKGSRD
jgi:hypothetical protein